MCGGGGVTGKPPLTKEGRGTKRERERERERERRVAVGI